MAQEDQKSNPSFSYPAPQCVRDICYEYDGVIFPNVFPKESLVRMPDFQVRPDDLFIISFPKTGTTWTENIVLSILNEGRPIEDGHIFMKIPFLEAATPMAESCYDLAEKMPSPRILKSHLLPRQLPKDIRPEDPKAKVIYVVRNPKDAMVSFYYHHLLMVIHPHYASWEEYFEDAVIGKNLVGGPFFENVLPWWKFRNHPNILFIKYEDMIKDLSPIVKKISTFMGKTLSDDVIDKVVSVSKFGAMKKNKASNPDSYIPLRGEKDEKKSFMRKGVVGDWKNHFTQDQNARFDDMCRKELAGSDLEFDYEMPINL